MWRNWQTRRSQTPVDIASLWVQVPSSAPKIVITLFVWLLFFYDMGLEYVALKIEVLAENFMSHVFKSIVLYEKEKTPIRVFFLFGAGNRT